MVNWSVKESTQNHISLVLAVWHAVKCVDFEFVGDDDDYGYYYGLYGVLRQKHRWVWMNI